MSEPISMSYIERIIKKNNPTALVRLFLKDCRDAERKLTKSLIDSMGVDSFIGYLINFKHDEINDTRTANLSNYILPSDQIEWFNKNHAMILAYGRWQAETLDIALADWLAPARLSYLVVSTKPDNAIPSEDVFSRQDLRILFVINGSHEQYYKAMAVGVSSDILLTVMTKFEMFLEENYS